MPPLAFARAETRGSVCVSSIHLDAPSIGLQPGREKRKPWLRQGEAIIRETWCSALAGPSNIGMAG
jgi:hypothetical protein